MTFIGASGSSPLTDHELIKLNRSNIVMMELLLRDTSLIALMMSLVKYGQTFESSHDAFFDEAHVCDICIDLVFC